MLKTIAQGSEEYWRLMGHVSNQRPGTLLKYTEVELITGVAMDYSGKSKLRRAILRSDLEYSVIPTVGYKLAEASDSMGIITGHLSRVGTSIKRVDRSSRVLVEQFVDALPDEEKANLLYTRALVGTFKEAAALSKNIYGQRQRPAILDTAATQPLIG